MTKAKDGAARTLEVAEGEIDRVRLILFAAYMLAFVGLACVIYTRGVLADWIAP